LWHAVFELGIKASEGAELVRMHARQQGVIKAGEGLPAKTAD
jgi:hypothetical protein